MVKCYFLVVRNLESPLNPHLGPQVDASTVRFGLRRIEARQGQLLLNGQPLMLLGLNRHESHPVGGVYLSEEPLELRTWRWNGTGQWGNAGTVFFFESWCMIKAC